MIPLPKVDDSNRHYWEGGAFGELRLLRCTNCRNWIHPPAPICPQCLEHDLVVEAVSGLGVLHTFTVNHQQWYPECVPPYAVGIVELAEQEDLRITAALEDVEQNDLRIGMPMQVDFEQREDVWLPIFRPFSGLLQSSGAAAEAVLSRPARQGHLTPVRGEHSAVISGFGQSAVGRRLHRLPLDLTLEAALAAIRSAGLTPRDIDGISTYPGANEVTPGLSGVGVFDVQDALRLRLDWFSGGNETPGQFGSIINACAAVSAGLAQHVLCFRTVWEGTAQGAAGRQATVTQSPANSSASRVGGLMQWTMPYAIPSAASWLAMNAQRHFHVYGTTRTQLAAIAVNQRENAGRNPAAIYREPLSLKDYLTSRMISDPLCLYDCDVPCDGSTAFVISRRDAHGNGDSSSIKIEAVGSAIHGRPSWDQWDDLTTMAMRDAANMMWRRTDLKPSDVDIAELYDGFSVLTLFWLEALGFCGQGDGGPFVEGGQRISLNGLLPVNTHGGQLSAGRLHGYGFLLEACLQLSGQGGARQVVRPGGRPPEVAVAAAGGGPYGACLLLTR